MKRPRGIGAFFNSSSVIERDDSNRLRGRSGRSQTPQRKFSTAPAGDSSRAAADAYGSAVRAAAARCAAASRNSSSARPAPYRRAASGPAPRILGSRTAPSAPAERPCAPPPIPKEINSGSVSRFRAASPRAKKIWEDSARCELVCQGKTSTIYCGRVAKAKKFLTVSARTPAREFSSFRRGT